MNLPVAPLAALFLGTAAAAAIAVLPVGTLESLVTDSGLPAILSAAEPPLGLTARLVLAAGAGAGVAVIVWFALFILLGTRGLSVGKEAEPVRVRRADAHPDAPPRAPLLATRDLGTPFLEVTAPRPEEKPEPVAVREPYREPLFAPLPAPVHVVAAEGIVPPEPLVLSEPVVALEPVAVSKPLVMPEPVAAPDPVMAAPAPVAIAEPVIAPRSLSVSQPVAEPEPVVQAAPVETPLAEQSLPIDLQQPLSAYDPGALLDVPMPPPVQLAPLRRAPRPQVFDAGERFETFELTPIRRAPAPTPAPRPVPIQRTADEALARPETDATIHALLERLERGVVKKGLTAPLPQTPREAERGLEDALVTLRNLARRA
jgi:hypothetical protein